MTTLHDAKRAALQSARLAQNLGTRLSTHERFTDPDLTSEAATARRQALVAKSLESARAKAQNLRQQTSAALEAAEAATRNLRPVIDPQNVADLTRSQQAWETTILPLVKEGKSWGEIVAAVDMDGLAALYRFGPQVINQAKTESTRPENVAAERAAMARNLQQMTDDRLAQIHPDEAARAQFKDAIEARQLHDAVSTVANGINHSRQSTDVQGILIAAQRRLLPLGAYPQEPPLPVDELDRIASNAAAGGHAEMAVSIPD